MAEGASDINKLLETVAKVKHQQDQHQKAIETITQQLTQFCEAAKEIGAFLSTRSFDSNNREESMMANEEGQELEDSSQKNKNGKHSEASEKGKTSSNKKMTLPKKHPTNSARRNISPKLENLNETGKEDVKGTPKKNGNIDDKKTKAAKNRNDNSPTSSTPKIREVRKRKRGDEGGTQAYNRANVDNLP